MNLDQDLLRNHSTLGAVVPLAMFYSCLLIQVALLAAATPLIAQHVEVWMVIAVRLVQVIILFFSCQKGVGPVLLKSSNIFSSDEHIEDNQLSSIPQLHHMTSNIARAVWKPRLSLLSTRWCPSEMVRWCQWR